MSLSRIFRDPIHGQIKFHRADLDGPFPAKAQKGKKSKGTTRPKKLSDEQVGWLIPKLIHTPEFQRLRHIRQNGLSNLVFHGAEHSRFSHSMGVAFLAREMFDRVTDNMDEEVDASKRLATVSAALLHDLGHGPFSHTIEDVIKDLEKTTGSTAKFHHEEMTRRFIEEPSGVNQLLKEADPQLPDQAAAYIDKSKRDPSKDHWSYRIVSSQLDADRLDYTLRDLHFAGLQGHGFDLARLLDMLQHYEGTRLAVNRRALEAVEAYLVTLEQAYRAIYFHRAIRSASVLLSSVIRRAFTLHLEGDSAIFAGNLSHPLALLLKDGQKIELPIYSRLTEFGVWALIDGWQDHHEPVLKDLSSRLMQRRLLKSIDVQTFMPAIFGEGLPKLTKQIEEIVVEKLPFCNAASAEFYVAYETSARLGYKSYDWKSETLEESIWLCDRGKEAGPIEQENDNRIIMALQGAKPFPRLFFPPEVEDDVSRILKDRAPK